MQKDCVGVIAAMPEEIAPLLRRVGDYRKEKSGGFNVYRFTSGGVPVVLVQSGMGPRHAAAATEELIALARPKVIVNFGFGGGVVHGLAVGDLVLARQVYLLEKGVLREIPQAGGRLYTTDALQSPLSPLYHGADARRPALKNCSAHLKEGTFITAAAIMNKREVSGILGGSLPNPVLEMETAAVIETAARKGVPVVAVRGISDAAEEELGFSLEEFCDTDLNIRLGRVLWCVAKRPWIIPQLLRLSANTKRAGENLALFVEALLTEMAKA